MAAAAGREEEPVEAVDGAEDRVPVGRDVVEADAAGDAAHPFEARHPADDAVEDVLLERGVDLVVVARRVDGLVVLREPAPDEQVRLSPCSGAGRM